MNLTYAFRGTYSVDYRKGMQYEPECNKEFGWGRGSAVERLLCKEDAKG